MEDRFIESPIFDNWFKKHKPKKSFWICSPYIKKDALDRVIELYDLNNRDDFDFKVLIRGNENEFTYQKSSDIAAFDSLLGLNGFDISNVRRITNLHMKAYIIDGCILLITSGNLTDSGMFVLSGKENFEGGISTCNPDVINDFVEYFSFVWEQGEVLEDFYDDLMSAYTKYIKTEYTDKDTWSRFNRRKYDFKSKSEIEKKKPIPTFKTPTTQNNDVQTFTLNDIPPVGSMAHVTEVLNILKDNENGMTYLELGKRLRTIFSDNESTTDGANRKFGEEKGKFAAFLNLVNIEDFQRGKIVKINSIGKAFLDFDNDSRNKLIKDIFFRKPIIVSIMRHSLETTDFNLSKFLKDNCKGATPQTLARKVNPLRELFSYISSICTEEELSEALTKL